MKKKKKKLTMANKIMESKAKLTVQMMKTILVKSQKIKELFLSF